MSMKPIPKRKCSRHGCNNDALYIPVVCVPAKSHLIMLPGAEVEVYRAHMNCPLCKKHAAQVQTNSLLSDKLAEQFIAQAQVQKKPPPDLERVYHVIESMGAPGYQAIAAMEANKGLRSVTI